MIVLEKIYIYFHINNSICEGKYSSKNVLQNVSSVIAFIVMVAKNKNTDNTKCCLGCGAMVSHC